MMPGLIHGRVDGFRTVDDLFGWNDGGVQFAPCLKADATAPEGTTLSTASGPSRTRRVEAARMLRRVDDDEFAKMALLISHNADQSLGVNGNASPFATLSDRSSALVHPYVRLSRSSLGPRLTL